MMLGKGIVYLVGAGPGDPELITVRGLNLLRLADVVVYDRLVARELLREARPGAEIVDAGKQPGRHSHTQDDINAMLVDRAKAGRMVVRLKGGDPFVFGRGGEEVRACVEAGVDCVVVPGVTSAVAAPAAAGIPVTSRGVSRSFAVVTARTSDGDQGASLDYRALAAMGTVVVLMGRANLSEFTQCLIDAGRDPRTPAACVERATTPAQRVTRATLSEIAAAADRDGLKAPVVTIIGDTAAFGLVNRSAKPQVAAAARWSAFDDPPAYSAQGGGSHAG